jgi:hypothetical protein
VDDDEEAHRRDRYVIAGETHQRRADEYPDQGRDESGDDAGKEKSGLRMPNGTVERGQPLGQPR